MRNKLINQSINHTLKLAHQRSSQIATVQVGMYIHTQYETIHIYCHVRENKQIIKVRKSQQTVV